MYDERDDIGHHEPNDPDDSHFGYNTLCSTLLQASRRYRTSSFEQELEDLYKRLCRCYRKKAEWNELGHDRQQVLSKAIEDLVEALNGRPLLSEEAFDTRRQKIKALLPVGHRPLERRAHDSRRQGFFMPQHVLDRQDSFLRPNHEHSLSHLCRFGLRHQRIYGISQAQLRRTWK